MIKSLTKTWRTAAAYLVGSRHSGDGNAFEARLRRWLIWFPLAGTVLLLAWTRLVRQPRMEALLGRNQDLIVLEDAIKDYRLRLSDQQFADLQVRLRDAELFILPHEAATGRLLAQILEQASAAGWTAPAAPEPATVESIPGLSQVVMVSQPLVLEHTANGGPAPYEGMRRWLGQLAGLDKRVDVAALSLEKGETGPMRVRLRLRFIQRSAP